MAESLGFPSGTALFEGSDSTGAQMHIAQTGPFQRSALHRHRLSGMGLIH